VLSGPLFANGAAGGDVNVDEAVCRDVVLLPGNGGRGAE